MWRVRAKLTADLKSAPPNYPIQLFTLIIEKILLPSVIANLDFSEY